MSNRTFLLAVGVLIASMVLTGVASGDSYYKEKAWRQSMNPEWEEILLIFNVISPIRFLGAIAAVAFSFNTINKERTEGSLKVLLSYPIYRDQVILGKLVAGILLIAIVTVVSMSLSLSVYAFFTSISITFELLTRFGAEMGLSVLLLWGYLGLGMLLSIILKDPKTTLIVTFLFIGLFNSVSFLALGNVLANLLFGGEMVYAGSLPWWGGDFLNPLARAFQVFISEINPSWGFYATSEELGIASQLVNLNGVVTSMKTNVLTILSEHLSALVILILLPVVTYILSYILFNKSDVT
jgi:ABC-2 type transport system permease protein